MIYYIYQYESLEDNMTLNELRYIVAVAQEKNFRRAADKVFVSQPALSLAIKNLNIEFFFYFLNLHAQSRLRNKTLFGS